jgi:UDPglucose 6-dehydrogenase
LYANKLTDYQPVLATIIECRSKMLKVVLLQVSKSSSGMGYDKRIGRAFLDAGLGYGGSCFPKDVRALAYMADKVGLHPQLLHAVMDINHELPSVLLNKLTSILGSLSGCTIAVLGLAFKPNTDDMREAPSVEIIRWLNGQGAQVRIYDPIATDTGWDALAREGTCMEQVHFCEDAYAATISTDALVIVTEWDEFKDLDMA